MRTLEQAKPTEQAAHTSPQQHGFHAELSSIWGMPPILKQAQEFASGVGEGLSGAVKEGVKSVAQAVTHPGETVSNAIHETGKAIKTGCDVTVAAAHYVGDKASHGDINGVVHDAQKAGQAIGHVVVAGAEQLAHMNAHDLGKVVGHDVLPGVIAAVVAPELAGEGIALAASAASKLGTLAKEEAALSRVVSVCENAKSKIDAISEKVAGLNRKMEELVSKPIARASEDIGEINAPRLKDGVIARGEAISDKFVASVEHSKKSLNELETHWLNKTKLTTVHNMAEEEGSKHAFAMGIWKKEQYYANPGEIKIAQVTGFKKDLLPNRDVRHSLAHEIGHSINDKFAGLNGPLSDTTEFIGVLKGDMTDPKTTKIAREARDTLKALYPDGNYRRHEIWAESFAIASDQELGIESTSRLGKLVKDGYPSAIKHIKEFREANKKP